LKAEPKRLWRRYLYLNPMYLALIFLQASKLFNFSTEGRSPDHEILFG